MQRVTHNAARWYCAQNGTLIWLLGLHSTPHIHTFTTLVRLQGRIAPGSNRVIRTPSKQRLLEEGLISGEDVYKDSLIDDELDRDDGEEDEDIVDIESLGDDPEELRRRIARLEEELVDLKTGRSLSVLSPKDREKVKHALQKTRAERSGATQDEAQLDLDLREIKFELPSGQNVKLQNLSKSLRQVATEMMINEPSAKAGRDVWKLYSLCKQTVPLFLQLVPKKAWDVLWESQTRARGSTKDRAEHSRILLEDMQQCERSLSPAQKLVWIETLYTNGRYEEAITAWQADQANLRNNLDTVQYCEDLGVRVYAAAGYPQEAQDLAFKFLLDRDKDRARILTPVIQAWARKGDDESLKKAWVTYLRLKMKLRSSMTHEDYDEITMCFLGAGRADVALAVFKDLMLARQVSQDESTELYKKSLGLFAKLSSGTVDVESLTNVSLTALTLLPRRFQNKFFFGSWLKKLLGIGQVNAAISVIELMVERGVKPDPKYLNGIVGAFLRSGSNRDKARGLELGRAMIEERLRFVAERRSSCGVIQSNATALTLSDLERPFHPSHQARIYVPPATIETFSLLLLYFQRRSMQGAIEQLKDSLHAAEIEPNTYFMNHLLYAALRQGEYQKVWNIYLSMYDGPKPDLETFTALWECEKAHLDHSTARRAGEFPGPRHTFCDMISWFSKKSPKEREIVRALFSRDMYTQIIRCMCLAKDLEGSLIAMYALKESFHLYPDEDTSRMIALQVARMGESKSRITMRQRRKTPGRDQGTLNVEKVAQVVQMLTEDREEALQAHSIAADDLSEDQLAEESLFLLATLLRTFLENSGASDDLVMKGIEKAAWDMGSSGLKMEDPLLSINT